MKSPLLGGRSSAFLKGAVYAIFLFRSYAVGPPPRGFRPALAHELVPDTPPPESIEAMLKARQVFARFAWQFPDNPKLAAYLYRVKCPTPIVWGEHDGVVPVTHGHMYQAEIGEAAFTVLPSSGHLPHLEQPEALANAVLEYLEQR